MPPADEHYTSQLAIQLMESIPITNGFFTPKMLHDLSMVPGHLNTLRRMSRIVTGSAALLSEDLKKITYSDGPKVYNLYGTTENMPSIQGPGPSNEPEYMNFHPNCGFEFRQYDGSDLRHLVVKRQAKLRSYQPVFMSYPNKQEFETNDLFSEHPQRPGYWRHRGRTDDLITTHILGLKMFVADIEQEIQRHEWISAVLIFSEVERMPLMILEPVAQSLPTTADERRQFIDHIWPMVEKANRLCVSGIRMQKDLVVVANTAFVRTAKHSVDRRRTVELFKEEIDVVYTKYERGMIEEGIDDSVTQ